jgi:UDP-N-acetylmuramoyl-L-alanyl-D-glutamate--2,6-diaminopimelate ligase
MAPRPAYTWPAVLLDVLLDSLDVRALENGRAGVDVVDLAYDSRRATPGALFVCVPGARVDGHDCAPQAVAGGAVALVCERVLPLPVTQVLVPSARDAMAPLADAFFGRPSADLRVAGVTGTNGKTTTAFLVRAILEAAGVHCGLLGTVEQVVGGVVEPVARTTPEAIDLQRTFRRMLDAGDGACSMEVSSHALALRRTEEVRFAAVCFTNLSQDHLDFHADMEDYFAAKARLFDGRWPAAANVDDPYGRRLAADLTFGLAGPADVTARDVALHPGGATFELALPAGAVPVETRLRGPFNVSNALAAAATAALLGIDPDAIAAGLGAVAGVPGRMEPVEAGQPFQVLVDYAHTPDALAAVLTASRDIARGRVIVVFGCGGDRDRGKRPEMGAIAARLADDVIVTSDNPRSEDPDAIIAEVVAGASGGVTVEPDRRRAIALAVRRAGLGDVVVIAGKGHEQGQERNGVVTPFDDRVVAREALG